jgi:hypothetical protein
MVARLRVGEGFGVRGFQHRAGGTGILLGKARKLEATRFATLNFTVQLIARSLIALSFSYRLSTTMLIPKLHYRLQRRITL